MGKTNICKICFKEFDGESFHSLIKNKISICEQCFNKFHPIMFNFKVEGVKALALYEYNEMFQEILYQFKGCYDIELNSVFLEYYIDYLKLKYKGYYMVPAPSYFMHDKNRGFNHVEEMFKLLNLKMISCFKKDNDIKQANLSFKERQNIYKDISIHNGEQLTNKNILLVDDVFTSGSTMKAMIEMVKKYNPKRIRVLVASKTKDNGYKKIF